MTSPRYRAVVLDGFTIVLDLQADEYVAVPQADPARASRSRETAECVGASEADVRFTDPTTVPRADRDLGPYSPIEAMSTSSMDWLRLIAAMPSAFWSLRFGRPRTWIRDEGRVIPAATPETIEAARRFRSMRPFVPMLSRCLPHALLLRAYLRILGHGSALVIGVRLFPFEAHSWVQAGDVVLTDDLDLVSAYSIIAAG